MNSGFGQQKWENLRRGIPIFHIILPVPSEPPLFRGLIQYSAPHWCTHPEAPEFHRFLYLFFQLFDSGFCFFQFVFQFSPAGLFFLLLLPGKLAVRVICFRCSGFSRIRRGRRIFSVSSSFSPDNNRSHQYNSQSPDGSGQESL